MQAPSSAGSGPATSWRRLGLLAISSSGIACGAPAEPPPDARPVAPLFGIAVVADCHLTTNPDRATRLAETVAWINDHAAERGIELVVVVGDIGWGAGVQAARDQLDALTVPYVPIIGDNEIHGGSEEVFDEVYASHFEALAATLDGFTRAPRPVAGPDGAQLHLQNLAFDHRGLHLVGLDFNDRETEVFQGELGVLHDVPGGTLPYLVASAATYPGRAPGSVLLFSHIPMHPGPFGQDGMAALRGVLGPHQGTIAGNFAGHIHLGYETRVPGLFPVYVTAATWVGDLTIRVIDVGHDGHGYVHTTETVVIPSAVPGA